ncbi:hypothetical protein GN956_G14709 [Arapaima gigas]
MGRLGSGATGMMSWSHKRWRGREAEGGRAVASLPSSGFRHNSVTGGTRAAGYSECCTGAWSEDVRTNAR